MALTAEESKAIADAIVAGLTPQFAAVTTALGDLKVATESKQVAVEATALSAREINEKITAAKLGDGATARVYEAVEAKDVIADEKFVDAAIARESKIAEEAMAAAKAELEGGNAVFIEAGAATGKGYQPGGVSAWASKEAAK